MPPFASPMPSLLNSHLRGAGLRHRYPRWLTLALSLAGCVLAAPAAAQTFSPERIRADVSFLADDKLEGRGTGTRGYDMAAAFVAARYADLGLKPGTANGWYQHIQFINFAANPSRPSSIIIGGKRFVHGDQVLVGPSALGESVEGEAEAVFVGYGLEDRRFGFDDYRGLDVRGKIVVQIAGTPDGLPGGIASSMSATKGDLAAARGAVGIITLLPPALLGQAPLAAFVAGDRRPQVRWIHPDGRAESEDRLLRLSAVLAPQAAERLFAGTRLGGNRLARMFADRRDRPKGFAIPGKVRIERFARIGKVQSPNVIAVLEGSDPALANEVVLLSAHLDHLGIIAGKGGDTIANGALDNAAGVATMLEVARAFVESGTRPRRSIMFAALTGEEMGLYGSEYLVQYPSLAGRKVVANVNLDMPILTYDFTDVVALGAEHSTAGEAVARAAKAEGLTISPDPNPQENFFFRSDHYSFVKKGIPALSIDPGEASGGKAAGELYRSTHYHQVSDDLKQPIDWKAGARFARFNYLVARDLADAAQAPRWYVGSYFGDRFAKDQPKAPKP